MGQEVERHPVQVASMSADRERPYCPTCGALRTFPDRERAIARIAERVAHAFGLCVSDLRGIRRVQEVVAARDAFVLMAREAGYSSPFIGRYLNRDHSTVLAAERRARRAVSRKWPVVSDKAVLRYLERGWGVDIEGLRRRIARMAQPAIAHSAEGVVVDGLRLIVKGGVVVSVQGVNGRTLPKRYHRRRQLLDK